MINSQLKAASNQLAGSALLPCLQYDSDLWFAEQPAQFELAKSLCQQCPMIDTCLANALERKEPWGVWGGQLFEAGRTIASKRGRGRPRKDAASAAVLPVSRSAA